MEVRAWTFLDCQKRSSLSNAPLEPNVGSLRRPPPPRPPLPVCRSAGPNGSKLSSLAAFSMENCAVVDPSLCPVSTRVCVSRGSDSLSCDGLRWLAMRTICFEHDARNRRFKRSRSIIEITRHACRRVSRPRACLPAYLSWFITLDSIPSSYCVYRPSASGASAKNTQIKPNQTESWSIGENQQNLVRAYRTQQGSFRNTEGRSGGGNLTADHENHESNSSDKHTSSEPLTPPRKTLIA